MITLQKNLIKNTILATISLTISLLLYGSGENKEMTYSGTIEKTKPVPVAVIDAGHGGMDGGAVGYDGTPEKELNLYLAEELYALFTNAGYNVIMTRDCDCDTDGIDGFHKRKDILNRISMAEKYQDAIFISLHLNMSASTNDHGFQVFYGSKNDKSKSVAEMIYKKVNESKLATRMRVVRECYDTIYIQHNIKNPSVLLECGFMSNATDYNLLRSSKYRHELMECIFNAVSEIIEKQ